MNYSHSVMALTLASSLLLSGCGSDSNNNNSVSSSINQVTAMTYSYQITVTNLTYSQPLSPIALILHSEGNLWNIGSAASTALEMLAEGGDNSEFLALMENTQSGETPLGAGQSATFTLTSNNMEDTFLTISSMLVNTNDAFVGLNALSLENLAVGDSITQFGQVYDAGTEANTEQAGTIPGPADGGVGYDSTRDDVGFVAMHSGVISQDDGLSTSVLSQAHQFDNPSVRFIVSRIE